MSHDLRRHIGQVTDVRDRLGRHHSAVVITIRLDETDPPAGRVSLADGRPVSFIGWLGLLRALSELLASPSGPARNTTPEIDGPRRLRLRPRP